MEILRTGRRGEWYGGGGRGRIYTHLYTVTTGMTPALRLMGNDGSHFNVSLIVRDKVTRLCPQTATFSKRKESRSRIEPRPSAYHPNALPRGQTDSHLFRWPWSGFYHCSWDKDLRLSSVGCVKAMWRYATRHASKQNVVCSGSQ